jgi:hypothetical protein
VQVFSPPGLIASRSEEVETVERHSSQHIGFNPPDPLRKRRWEGLHELNPTLVGELAVWRCSAERHYSAKEIAVREAGRDDAGGPSFHHLRRAETGIVIAKQHRSRCNGESDRHFSSLSLANVTRLAPRPAEAASRAER